jgi:quercetin dioxygenase-like cupin family protein
MPISTATADHYLWASVCDGWHLLKSPGLSVIQERMPPGTTERRHLHTLAQQFFYVLSGQLTMELNGATEVIPTGHGIVIPPGAPHQAVNSSAEDVHFLVISAPPSHGDRTDL